MYYDVVCDPTSDDLSDFTNDELQWSAEALGCSPEQLVAGEAGEGSGEVAYTNTTFTSETSQLTLVLYEGKGFIIVSDFSVGFFAPASVFVITVAV